MADAGGSDRFLEAFDRWQMASDPPRPRLFVPEQHRGTLGDIPETSPDVWKRVQESADWHLQQQGRRYVGLPQVGLAYLVSGRREYADLLAERTERALAAEDWVLSTHRSQGITVDLGVAGEAAQVAWAYDWLYGYLPPQQRERWRDAILKRGLELFLPVHRQGSEWWSRSLHNWRAVICGDMGLAAMAVAGEWPAARDSLRESLVGVLATLEANPKDGSYVEGLGYWSYGIGKTLWFAEALRAFTNGAVDLFQHPYLQKTAEFALYMTTPDLGSFNFGDDHYGPPSGDLLLLLAARTADGHAQWLAERLEAWHPLSVFWREDVPAARPPDALPLVKDFPAAGATVLRSDWSDDAVYVGLKTGQTTANHSHLDINSFLVNAFGKRLLLDPGGWHYDHAGGFFDTGERRWDYPANNAEGHTTLLVEGEGQRYGEAHRGEVTHLESSPEFSYAVAEGAAAYGPELRRFDRHLVLAKEGYLIVVDEIETSGRKRLAWHWQTGGEADLGALADGRVEVRNERAALTFDLLWPDPAEGRTVRRVSLTAHYIPAWDPAPELQEQSFSYLSIVPLHRQEQAILVAVLWPRLSDAPAPSRPRLLQRRQGQVELEVGATRWSIQLRERKVNRA